MNKYLIKIFSVIICFFIIYILYALTLKKYFFYSTHIEVQIPILTKIEEKDTHGGFHGDGEAFAKVYFSDKQAQKFIKKIEVNQHWNKLPMPETIQKCVSHCIDDGIRIPFVENGYWFFLDRHSDATDKYDYSEIFERYSLNYSIAVMDLKANILYYYALDT